MLLLRNIPHISAVPTKQLCHVHARSQLELQPVQHGAQGSVQLAVFRGDLLGGPEMVSQVHAVHVPCNQRL